VEQVKNMFDASDYEDHKFDITARAPEDPYTKDAKFFDKIMYVKGIVWVAKEPINFVLDIINLAALGRIKTLASAFFIIYFVSVVGGIGLYFREAYKTREDCVKTRSIAAAFVSPMGSAYFSLDFHNYMVLKLVGNNLGPWAKAVFFSFATFRGLPTLILVSIPQLVLLILPLTDGHETYNPQEIGSVTLKIVLLAFALAQLWVSSFFYFYYLVCPRTLHINCACQNFEGDLEDYCKYQARKFTNKVLTEKEPNLAAKAKEAKAKDPEAQKGAGGQGGQMEVVLPAPTIQTPPPMQAAAA